MQADERILKMPHVPLNSRQLLPEKSGIYYVVDEYSIVFYIGQATNLRNRWQGESHHRFNQLKKQRKKHYTLYYEFVAEHQLDIVEKENIARYNPELNGTKVQTKQLRPTETLLREVLSTLAEYLIVLGVEPPRSRDKKFNADFLRFRGDTENKNKIDDRLTHNLETIHLCLVRIKLVEKIGTSDKVNKFLKQTFKTRTNYYSNWEYCWDDSLETSFRLLVNTKIVAVRAIALDRIESVLEKEDRYLSVAGIQLKVFSPNVLEAIQAKYSMSMGSIYCKTDKELEEHKNNLSLAYMGSRRNSPYRRIFRKFVQGYNERLEFNRSYIKRVIACSSDPIQAIINEPLAKESKLDDFIEKDRIIDANKTKEIDIQTKPTRLENIANKKRYLKHLLIQQGCDLDRYRVSNYLDNIPQNEGYHESNRDSKIEVYVTSFIGRLNKNGYPSWFRGSKGSDEDYSEIYLQTTVDRAFWTLLEPYIADFVKVELAEDEGYIEKAHVSARRYLVPAKIGITLNGRWKADIPFGRSKNMASYIEVKETISQRLQESGIPDLKFIFKSESTRSF